MERHDGEEVMFEIAHGGAGMDRVVEVIAFG